MSTDNIIKSAEDVGSTGVSLIKSLLPSPWLIIIFIAILTATNSFTWYETSKYEKTKAQVEIDKINSALDKANADWKAKLDSISKSAYEDQLRAQNQQQQINDSREKVITKYVTKWKEKPGVCSIDSDTSQAINEILNAK